MFDPSSIKVLIVDDNEFARATTRNTLSQLGIHRVEEALNGAEALALLLSQPYDLLLTDWYMPDVDGAGLVTVIRDVRVKSENQETPIIVTSAYANNENFSRAYGLGCNDFIVKPVDKRTLGASVLKLFSADISLADVTKNDDGEVTHLL